MTNAQDCYAVSQKLVISGNIVERYSYEKPYFVGFPRIRHFKQFDSPPKFRDQVVIRDDNVRRARQKIRRLINCNPDLEKFMTLTFDINKVTGDITNLDIANNYFNIFIKRLKRVYPDLKYIAVPEFQKKGRIHYHLLTNIKEYISNDYLADELWTYGFAWLRKTYNVDNLGAYVCKYLSKEIFDKRYFRKKKFFYSLNLLKPVIIDKLNEVKEFLGFHFFNLLETCHFDCLTDFLGQVYYYRYKMSIDIKVATQ